ncbi:MAG: biotin/lipoyl-binding protein [Patescibacteria group bacterium]
MAERKFEGQVIADVIELRFASSGKLVSLSKKLGDFVTRGEIIAVLDKKLLQLELDQKLADSMIVRSKKVMVQADLDASVRDVELAKYKLDQTDLYAPCNGQIIDLGGNIVGLNVTPSANAIKIIKIELIFRIKIKPEEVHLFNNPGVELPIDFPKIGKKIFAKPSLPRPNDDFEYFVDFALQETKDLPVGIEGILVL